MDIFEDGAFKSLTELGINPYDTVFVKTKPLTLYHGKRAKSGLSVDELLSKLLSKRAKLFMFPLKFVNGLYSFAPPKPVYFGKGKPPKPSRRLLKQTDIINRRLLAVNNAFLRKTVFGAKKNAEFVRRFNNELFFKNAVHLGVKLSMDELFAFFETEPYYKRINLSSHGDKSPFISMYAIAFKGCSTEDMFTVDGIFSVQTQRHIDNLKKEAGNDVFNLLLRNDKTEIDGVLEKMADALLLVEPIKIVPSDVNTMAKNYTAFVGLSEIGRVMAEVFFYNGNRKLDPALKAAVDFKNYKKAIALCEKISRLSDNEDYRETKEYADALAMDKIGLSPYVKWRGGDST